MSTILKALKRVEDEKKVTRELSLNEQVVARSAPPPRGNSGGVVAVLAGGVATGLAIYYFWPDPTTPLLAGAPQGGDTVAASSADSEPRTTPARASRRATSRQVAAMEPEIELIPDVQIVKRLEPPATPSPEVADGAPTNAEKSAGPVDDRRGRAAERRKAVRARSRENKPASEKPAAPKNSLSEPEVTMPAQVASDPPKSAPPSGASATRATTPSVVEAVPPVTVAAPLVSQTSPPAPEKAPPVTQSNTRAIDATTTAAPDATAIAAAEKTSSVSDRMVLLRAKIPDLVVQRTIWHPEPDRRVAVVKLEDTGEVLRLRQGDAIGPLVVQEIEPAGVFFAHDGIALRRAVGGR